MNQTITDSIETAQNKIESIRQALINGDTKLKPKDLLEAKNELEFAELQAEAARIAERKANEAARLERLKALRKRLRETSDTKAVNEAKERFEKAFDAYLQQIAIHNKNIADLRNEMIGFESDNFPGLETDAGKALRIKTA